MTSDTTAETKGRISPHVLWFDQIRHEDLGKVGGKGANLGELVRAGLPVPQGFCVSAQAYQRFLTLTGIDRKIDAELAAEEAKAAPSARGMDELGSADQLSERIRQFIESQTVPDEIAGPVLDAYRELHRKSGVNKVAVRSSATAEDLPGFSFAGQQDTYLGIRGDQAVLDAVKRCWASLWTSRALTYRRMHGFRHQDVYIAVVVQEMFPSQVSGVLFTADPLTGSRRKMIVSASLGLGEAVVSGIVTPDYWVLNRETGAVIEEKIGEKAERIDQAENGSGVVHSIVPIHERERACLTPDQLRELARIASGIEAHYGYPQDVEWGYSGTRFAILQSREVTGVPVDFGEELERWNVPVPPDDNTIWSRAWSDFGQPGASTPLMYSIQQSFIHRTYEDMFRLFGLKSFLNRRMWQWHRCRPYWSSDYEERRLRLIPKFARNDDALCFWPPTEHARLRELPFDFWKLAYGQIHALLTTPRYSFWFCADTFYNEYPEQIARYEAAMNIDFEMSSVEQILASLAINEQCFIDHSLSVTPGVMTYCYFLVLALSEATKNWCGDADQSKFGTLLSGLATRTVLGNIETWRLARDIDKSAALRDAFASKDASVVLQRLRSTAEGTAYLGKIDAYIQENGHRGGSERDLVFPRWRHRPELLINALRSLAGGDETTNAELLEERMVRRREQTAKELTDHLRQQNWGWFKTAVFKRLLKWTHKYVKFRDDQRFFADYYMASRHDFFLAIGKRLVAKGLLEKVDDIFFLGLEEIQDVWHGKLSPAFAKRRIEARRTQHEKYSLESPPAFVRQGLPFEEIDEGDGDRLTGIAASGGRIYARARVCRTLEEASHIERGDILVATATDPGWTPIFSMLSGLVVETGGPLAHATLVSREYGIPCVTNVVRATERITDGQMITVDGNLGIVLFETDVEHAA